MLRKAVRQILKWILSPFLLWRYQKLSKNDQYLNIKGLSIKVIPGVFHPGFFISTKTLIRFFESFKLANKTVLELGSGSGAFSVWAAQQKAIVTAVDIHPGAVKNTLENAANNQVALEALESDLFSALPNRHFDFIAINPPYYPKAPQNNSEKAWFCGLNFEYFHQLFATIQKSRPATTIVMIVSEDCAIEQLSSIAKKYQVQLQHAKTYTYWYEYQYVFELKSL